MKASKWESSSDEDEPVKIPPVAKRIKIELPKPVIKSYIAPNPPSPARTSNFLRGPSIKACRSVHVYENLNLIDEGIAPTY